jgi:spermidine synthase
MIVELAAVRLLSPWFGASLVVWTNVIAVILLALSLGYLLGARLSDGGSPLRRLGWMLCSAALCAAWLPVLSGLLAPAFVPARLALHDAADVVLWGSLATSLVLFLPPALLLGAVTPLAAQAIQEQRGAGAGRSGGAVLWASTLGSLVGVFGTSHLLLPGLGLQGTFLLAALVLFAAGATAVRLGRGGLTGLLLFALAGACSCFVPSAPVPAPDGRTVLAERESPYQLVRVVEEQGAAGPVRLLQVNEGFDSFQSVWQPQVGALPEGYYYNAFALPAWWAEASGPWRVLVLGHGAGSATRVLDGASPPGLEPAVVGVELDPVVVELAREHMQLDARDWRAGDHGGVVGDLDARLSLRLFESDFDLVVLDCYANQVEIPAHLCTLEFFRELRGVLASGGWLAVNLGGFGFDDPLVEAVARTCALAWEARVCLLRIPKSRNFCLLARLDAPLPVREEGGVEGVPEVLRPALGALELPEMTRWIEPSSGDAPLTDAHCPVEKLQLRSIAEGRWRRRGAEDRS